MSTPGQPLSAAAERVFAPILEVGSWLAVRPTVGLHRRRRTTVATRCVRLHLRRVIVRVLAALLAVAGGERIDELVGTHGAYKMRVSRAQITGRPPAPPWGANNTPNCGRSTRCRPNSTRRSLRARLWPARGRARLLYQGGPKRGSPGHSALCTFA